MKLWTPEEAKADALAKHPDCSYADWQNGLGGVGGPGGLFQPTIVVQLWRNEECYLNDDPPKYVTSGYPRESWSSITTEETPFFE